MALTISTGEAVSGLRSSTHVVKERTWRNPDGEIVTTSGLVVGGATLIAAPGDEMPTSQARELGLLPASKVQTKQRRKPMDKQDGKDADKTAGNPDGK